MGNYSGIFVLAVLRLCGVVFCSDGGFLSRSDSRASKDSRDAYTPAVPPKMIGYMDDDSSTQNSTHDATYELPLYNEHLVVSAHTFYFSFSAKDNILGKYWTEDNGVENYLFSYPFHCRMFISKLRKDFSI